MKKEKIPSGVTTVILPISLLNRIEDVCVRQGTSKAAVIRQALAAGLPVLRAQIQYSVAEKPPGGEGAHG